MYPKFNTQRSEPFTVRKRLNDQHILPNPSLATDGFNIWWQKTAARNMAMLTEASDLMHAHSQDSSARLPTARQAH